MRPDAFDPDPASEIHVSLRKVAHRLRTRWLLRAAALAWVGAAAVAASLIYFTGLGPAAAATITLCAVALALGTWSHLGSARWSIPAAAEAVERAWPESRNVVVTAAELARYPERAQAYIRERVQADAAAALRSAGTAVVPGSRGLLAAGVAAAVLWSAVIVVTPRRGSGTASGSATTGVAESETAGAGAVVLVARIDPPTYTGREPATVRDPQKVEAVQGSRLAVALTGQGEWRVRFNTGSSEDAGRLLVASASERTPEDYDAQFTLRENGYLAIEPASGNGTRRLIPVAVIPDRAPAIRIHAPGKDLLLPAASGSIAVSTSATDDFGLERLELRYTKVTGSGEQFEFVEGTLPLNVTRESTRAWQGRATVALSALKLEPGDALVYRAVAKDRRPGNAGLSSSETYFIEIAGPGQVALEGFEMPPDRERYGLSQQMIVLKIERLRAREKGLARETLEEETASLAAEQRSVRANFIFLLGGHVEDEEEEAAHSHEIQEGRLENTARREINAAVQHMTTAERALVAVDTAAALTAARAAVAALQRAFGRNRYFLRTLPVRSRIDPSRRLTGELDEAASPARTPPGPNVPRQAIEARDLLARLMEIAGTIGDDSTRGSAPTLAALAEKALAVAPDSPDWQTVAARLMAAREAAVDGAKASAVRRLLNEAVQPLTAIARRAAVRPGHAESSESLRSAWAEERRPR